MCLNIQYLHIYSKHINIYLLYSAYSVSKYYSYEQNDIIVAKQNVYFYCLVLVWPEDKIVI